jgi:hypothetical protein
LHSLTQTLNIPFVWCSSLSHITETVVSGQDGISELAAICQQIYFTKQKQVALMPSFQLELLMGVLDIITIHDTGSNAIISAGGIR